ncbi:MAG: Ketopantoate hydroxymethyltransferase [Pedobacter sp.]|jgi:3-methyl-2-oxobutanoate hydroxymethyltransferase|nr:Ketopantoate hydroxymethyltransferase [Pedobacter sp.]
MKDAGDKNTKLTAYDFSMARIFDEACIDVLLVGDLLPIYDRKKIER